MYQLTSVRSLRLRFAAGPDWSGPTTLGQRNVMAWIERLQTERTDVVWFVQDVPAGVGLDAVAGALTALLLRHEALRTTYTRDADGEPAQHVAGTGEVAVEVFEDADDADLPTVLDLDDAWKDPFELATEFGIRIGVYTRRGRPVLILLVLSHMAADYAAGEILLRDLQDLLVHPGGGAAKAPHQPRDQAARELAPPGRRRTEASLRHWDAVLRKAPQCMFSLPPDPAGAGQVQAVLRSRAAALALDAIAARTRASHSTVLFAAAAALLSHRTGNDSCQLVSLSSNRFAPGGRDYVGTIAQDSVAHLEIGEIGATFDDVVRRAGTATMRAYSHAQYDALRLYEVMGAVEYERGTRFHRDCVFSDLSVHRGSETADRAARPPDQHRVMAESEITFVTVRAREVQFLFELYELGDRATIMLMADTRFLSPAEIEGFLCGVERLLVAAADRVVAIAELGDVTGVPAPVRGEGWVRVDGCWVQPEAVQQLMDGLDLVKCARVFVEEPDDGTPTVTAYVVPADPATAPQDVHMAAVAHLRGRFTAMAPQRYVLCSEVPEHPEDAAAWRLLEPLAAGTGRLATLPVGRPEEIWCPPQ